MGRIVAEEWKRTLQIRGNIKLDEFIIMPNHVHGIIIIDNGEPNLFEGVNAFLAGNYSKQSNISPKPNSLGAIIGQIKSISKKRIQKINPYFNWQPRFYDRIIRNESGLTNARCYVKANPDNWGRDKNNQAGLGM